MLRKTEQKQIGADTYEVTQMGAVKGSQVFVRLIRAIGPIILAADKASDLRDALAGLKEEDVDYLIKAFSPYTLVQGKGELDKIFDIHFAGKYGDMFQWLWASVEVNFGSFLGASALAGLPGVNALKSNSQTVATGQSGGSS